MLRQQIESVGLWHLVAKNPDEMLDIVDHSLDGTHFSSSYFDPLLMANYIIWENSDPEKQDGGFCPLCDVAQAGGNAEERICDAANLALQEARKLNLVPPLQ